MTRSVLETYAVARAIADPAASLAQILPQGVELATCRADRRFYLHPGARECTARTAAWHALLRARRAREIARRRMTLRVIPQPEGAA